MPKFKDRVWERYWRLTVISQAERSETRKWIRWNCKCDCGNKKIVFSDELSSWKSNSCWCLKKEILKNSWFQFRWNKDRKKQILKNYSNNSRFKKIGSTLTFEDIERLSYQNCYYCWQEPNRIIEDRRCNTKSKWKISKEFIKINWIDRIDSNLTYTKENTVSCCEICNRAKSTLTQEEFYKWIKKVNNYLCCLCKYKQRFYLNRTR